MSIARDRANRVGSDPLVIGASKISSNASDDLVVQDTSDNPKRLITSEVQIGDDDNDKIIIKRDSSTGKVNLQTVSGGGSPADQPTGGLTIYANTSDLPASADEGVMALVTANNFMYVYKSGWYKVAEITNATPTISSAGNASYSFATDGTPVSIEVTASDPEGVPLQYKYTVTSGSLTNGGGATAAVTSSATSGGTYSALAENTLTSNKYFKITPSTNSSYSGAFSLTFHASDGVNVANSSASAFTLAFSHDIEILVVGGGGGGGKAGFTDYQSGAGGGGGVILSGTYTYSPGTQLDIVVGAGGAGIAASTTRGGGNPGTASSVQVNGAGSVFAGSTQFDGNNDNLTISSTNIINSLANFTVEAWAFYDDEAPGDEQNILEFNSGTRIIFGRRKVSSNLTAMYVYSAATSDLFTNDAAHHIVSNRWVHLAWVKEGQNFRMYIDGKNVAGNNNNSATNMAATPSASLITIGENSDGYEPMHGYLSNVRVSSTARYGADFTRPSAAFTNDSDTILLTCQNSTGAITDASSNNYTVTANNGAAANTKVLTSYLALARGGGGGGAGNNSAATEVGGNGANGGGGYAINGGTSGKSIPGQGYGIDGVEVSGFNGFGHWGGYGGGGGGGAGANATDQHGGDGVNTYSAWATATSTGDSGYYGGGGAGSKYDGANATHNGGQGGGGDGTFSSGQTWVGQDGAANTGGGGGAGGGRAGDGAAGAGGSGIVIIRYAGGAKNSQGDSVHTSGGYTYHVYSSTGSATYIG
tara:strand:- start:19077 stop:21356 length:2280 start_codon:yes stop_codon:yes gene_type:complete